MPEFPESRYGDEAQYASDERAQHYLAAVERTLDPEKMEHSLFLSMFVFRMLLYFVVAAPLLVYGDRFWIIFYVVSMAWLVELCRAMHRRLLRDRYAATARK
jgi:hypothetical protein